VIGADQHFAAGLDNGSSQAPERHIDRFDRLIAASSLPLWPTMSALAMLPDDKIILLALYSGDQLVGPLRGSSFPGCRS